MGSSGFFMALPFLFRKESSEHAGIVVPGQPAPVGKERPAYLLILFLVTITLRFVSITGVINFTTTYLVYEIRTSAVMANFMAGFAFLGGMLLTPFFGYMSDRFEPMNLFLITTGLCAPCILVFSMVSNIWVVTIVLFVSGIVFYATSPPMDLLLSRFSAYIGKGEAFGYIMSVFAVITALSPAAFGLLADRIGLRLTVALFSIPPFLGFLLLLYTARKMNDAEGAGSG
jgi:MFS family permease